MNDQLSLLSILQTIAFYLQSLTMFNNHNIVLENTIQIFRENLSGTAFNKKNTSNTDS